LIEGSKDMGLEPSFQWKL